MGDDATRRDPDPLSALAGGGEMGRRIRDFDWSATPLGPIDGWPHSLRSALSICLNSNFPIAIYWGSDLVLLYNDQWSPIPGAKHPWVLGRPAREAWPEIWHIIEPLFGRVMATGEATRSRDQLLPMHRHGFTEECYFDYTFSPIRGQGGQVEGVFNAVLETTTRVIGERRLRTLRELGAWKTREARTAEEACQTAAHIIAQNRYDLPFALVYLLDGSGRRATLAGLTGLDRDTEASPATVDLDSPEAPWPFRPVAETGKPAEVRDLPARFGPLPGGAWPESPERAVVLPLAKSGQTELAGFVVAGVSPRLALNDDYRGFLDLLAGHVAAAVASARAYEEERRRAEALAELDRAKTAFFSNVSHEFRTPLTLMLGPVEDMLAKPAEEVLPDNRQLLEVVHRNGLRLQRLVNALLDFSRIEAGRVRATFEPTDLAAFTVDLASNFRSACERAGLKLTVDCPPVGEPVFVDRPMWEKVVLNLLSNAFKFTFEGGITVTLRRAGQSVELRVRDTGTGIPAEEMPRIFERFHRIENARARTHEGSGIGLALVHDLIRLHGGSITVQSEVGQGTTFTVTIPLGSQHLPREQVGTGGTTAPTAAAVSPFVEEALRWLPSETVDGENTEPESLLPTAQSPLSTSQRPRVLVADDNADMRRYVQRLLSGSYTVEAVADGAAALECVRRQPPDLILSDVMMPRLDGFGLLQQLRADPRTAGLPVILLSARAGEESRVEGMQAGADDYLVKPFSARELLARVSSLLQIARLRRESEQALRASEEHLRAVVETSPACIKIVAADGTLVAMNPAGLAMVDAERPEQVCGASVYGIIRAEDRDAFRQFNERICRGESGTLEFEIQGLRGTRRRMETYAAPLRGADGSFRQLAITHDITERKRSESLQAGQRGILEMIARGAPLPEVLTAVCRLIEGQEPGLLCSILLTDDSGQHTGTGVGPSLPDAFVQTLGGIKNAPPHVGLCCEALDCGQEILVADIENDGRWSPLWRELNLRHGLRACRSIPIFGSDGTVLASVAVFRQQPGDPGPANRELLGIATHLAGVAIERRRAEARERELLLQAARSNAQFRALFEQGGIFAGVMHIDGTLIEANRLSLEACGYTREQVIGKPFWNGPWWNRSAELMQRIKDAIAQVASGEAYRAELPYFVADGSQRVVDFILLPMKDEAGRVVFLAPTGTDITDRKRAERELAEAHEFLQSSLDALSSHIAVLDENGVILAVNDAWRRFADENQYTGHNYGVGSNYIQACEPDGGKCMEGSMVAGLKAVLAGRLPLFEHEYPCHSPTEQQWFMMRATRFKSPGPVRVVVAHENVTKRKKAEDALKEADRRKDEFLATLAHELRNPLAPIRNGLQVMRLSNGDRAAVEKARTMMERQLGQMVHLVDDLLDLSRISRGKIELRKERVELAKVVQHAVETSRPLIEAGGHELTITMPPGPVYVDADLTRLAQVFSNLLNNAAKYTERGGHVHLSVQRRGDEVIVSVKDNGVGIPANMLQKVFEMFTQVDRNLERSQGGLGIGLSIVKRLVEMHGGSVGVQSEGPGRGSEFTVRLPVVLSVAGSDDRDGMGTRPSGRRRILVVDDNEDAAVSLAMMLELMGNETKTAHDGVEALDVAGSFRPDLVLLDIGMPRLNGYDAARHIREQPWGKGVMLVALTGWGQEEDRRRSQEAGFNAHMTKPVELAALEKLLAGVRPDTA